MASERTAPRRLVRAELNVLVEDLKHAGCPVPAIRAALGTAARAQAIGAEPAAGEKTPTWHQLRARLDALHAELPPARPAPAYARRNPAQPLELRVSREKIRHVKWRGPAEEFRGTARLVGDLLAGDPDLLPCEVCVAVPSRTWAAEVARELEARRIETQVALDDDPVAGDPRSRERLGTLEAYAALALAADPADPAAWRLWLALGEPDLACTTWERLCAYVREQDLAPHEGVAAAHADPAAFAGAPAVAARVADAAELLERLGKLHGFALRSFLCARWPQAAARLRPLLDACNGDEDAPGLFRAFQERSFAPGFVERPSQVSVGSYRTALALEPRHLLLPGLVRGLVPAASDRLDDDRRLLGALVETARDSLTVSTFRHAGPAVAARLGLPVEHLRRWRGADVAVVARSPLIDAAGDALPGSVSGEQLFGADRKDAR